MLRLARNFRTAKFLKFRFDPVGAKKKTCQLKCLVKNMDIPSQSITSLHYILIHEQWLLNPWC